MTLNILLKKRNPFLLTAAAVAAAACAVPTPLTAEHLPLVPGSVWMYRAVERPAEFTMRVGSQPYLIQGNAYYPLIGYARQPLLVRTAEDGSLLYRDEDADRDRVLTLFTPMEGIWFEAPERICDSEGKVEEKKETYDGPAGRFSQALRIVYRNFSCADVGVTEELYVENIGMVRRVMQTIAGPLTFELVNAGTGKIQIQADSAARFEVTLDPPAPQARELVANLRLTVPPEQSLVLTFPTSQEYDVALRDEQGNRLWVWSADKLFLQMIQEKVFIGHRTWRVVIPVAAALGGPLRPGKYVLEAWLMAGQSNREFAAALPFEIPAEETNTNR
jgi:hypothetical protein